MNSDFLSDVLSSQDEHLPSLTSKISEVVNRINVLKSDVKTVVEQDSIEINPLLKENQSLKLKADELLKEMTLLAEEMDGTIKEEVKNCNEELKGLSSSLKEVNMLLLTLKQLLEINALLNKAKQSLSSNEYFECAEITITLKGHIKNNSENLKEIEIFKILSQEVSLTYEQLIYQMSEVWSQEIDTKKKSELDNNITLITVAINTSASNKIVNIIKASNVLKENLLENKFSNFLLTTILDNIIRNKSEVDVQVKDQAILSVKVFCDKKKSNYLEVFDNIKEVVKFLKSYLGIEVANGIYFLFKVGSLIANDFADSLIKNCLSETIPASSDDLDKYKEVVENTEDFEKTLQENGFLPPKSSLLLDYARNINVLFANKCCQSYLQKARTLMKKDLHNTIESREIVSDLNIFPQSINDILREKMSIYDDILTFPKCQISKQADELMSLIYDMMKEIEKSLDLFAVRLFYTVRNIFEMYAAIVPLHHKKFLEKLPHQVAIFHNNCMFFAHCLINIVAKYYEKIPKILKDHFVILLEEAVVLRSLAAETLEVTVTNQRNQLLYILQDSSFATLNTNPNLSQNSEKIIRQCIRQLQILKNVWSDVLPLNIYNRAIGFMLDAIIEELISLITAVEDISSQTAFDLESNFNIILEKAPTLFPEPKEVHRHSRKWQKFKEFVLILKGSLRDIDDRWADGMGPLAIEFTAEQVKHLVRALFQNSTRRAALLSKIRT